MVFFPKSYYNRFAVLGNNGGMNMSDSNNPQVPAPAPVTEGTTRETPTTSGPVPPKKD
jgi:hypothetical protein